MKRLLQFLFNYRLLALIKKEFNQIRRDRRLAISLILPPVVQLTLFGFALSALDFYLGTPLEVVIVGSPSPELDKLLRTVWRTYLPNRVIANCHQDYQQAAAVVPLFVGRDALATEPTAFVCRANTCQQPAHTSTELVSQLIPTDSRTPVAGS